MSALNLLERASGPILEDFPDDAPGSHAPDEAEWVCPVTFAAPLQEGAAHGLQREITELAPWHDLAVQRSGRRAAGLSGLGVIEAANVIMRYIQIRTYTPYRDDLSPGLALRLACEDLKSYYFDALAAQPGNPSAEQMEQWFWRTSVAGRALLELQQVCMASPDKSLKLFAQRTLVPRAISHGAT